MSDSILKGCNPVTSMDQAKEPVVSALLPVKGLRHDDNGELTKDAIQIINDGIKSLGVDPTAEESRAAILSEAKHVLCKINAQYEFMLGEYSNGLSSNKPASKELFDQIKEKHQGMKDIISISRHILDMPIVSKDDPNKMKEGFQDDVPDPNAEMRNQLNAIDSGLMEFGARNYELSNEKNNSMNAYLNMYGYLNVVAIGLLFYIAMARP